MLIYRIMGGGAVIQKFQLSCSRGTPPPKVPTPRYSDGTNNPFRAPEKDWENSDGHLVPQTHLGGPVIGSQLPRVGCHTLPEVGGVAGYKIKLPL